MGQTIALTSFRLPQQQTLRKGFQCKAFIWEVIPRNRESKTGKERKAIKGIIKLLTTVDTWSSVLLALWVTMQEPRLTVLLPNR